MRRFIKIVSLLLAISVLAGVLVSCKEDGPKKEGDILVVYNGIPVFASEVQDIINYALSTKMTDQTTEEQMQIIMGEAIGVYVQHKILELDFNERGIKVDEKVVKNQYKLEKESIEETYEGGYKAWMEDYGVSEYFLKEEVRRYVLADMFVNDVSDEITVSEDEMKAYMSLHSNDYYNPAGYGWTMIFREVKDITDETECAAAEAETQDYINKIASGKMTLADAKKELLEKYTAKDGYTKAAIYSGSDFTSLQNMPLIETREQLEVLFADMDEFYKDRDFTADKDSQQYANYMHWIAERFEAETYYALQTTEVGEVYTKPIKNFVGYGILCVDSVVTKNSFDAFEDVKDELAAKVFDQKIQEKYLEYLEELHHKYDVQYLYTSLG